MNQRAQNVGQIIVAIAFALSLLIFFINVTNFRGTEVPQWEFYLLWVGRFTGTFVAGIAAVLLLIRAIGGAGTAELSSLILPLLAGLSLTSGHWSTVLVLGLLLLCILVGRIIRQTQKSKAE
ncbi:MAG: hypothetical protein HKN23_08060 [Verrucomicrobiales bacterium]|nr:hypothetical protein [Verrucomicrobiales bacterium]